MALAVQPYFVYGETMELEVRRTSALEARRASSAEIRRASAAQSTPATVPDQRVDDAVSSIAAAIGEPARTRMLYSLMDGHARTGTELAIVAEVSPSTASVHLNRLKSENLVRVHAQGRHRYFALASPNVARALERLSVLAGGARRPFVPHTPEHLRAARSCYDHMAGAIAVSLHDRFLRARWIEPLRRPSARRSAPSALATYDLTPEGTRALAALGLDLEAAHAQRRRFAYACLDWSERRPHVGGALGAALLSLALSRKWLARELDSRALFITRLGRSELNARFGLEL
jgi:DNA-binding transcriptional ArsR family regulator